MSHSEMLCDMIHQFQNFQEPSVSKNRKSKVILSKKEKENPKLKTRVPTDFGSVNWFSHHW